MAQTIVIVGAGAAGRSAASAAKKTNPQAKVILIGKEENIYVRCSAPYAISGENKLEDLIKPWKGLTDQGIELVSEEAVSIDSEERTVKTKRNQFSYDSLVLATGAEPIKPPIKGADLANVFTLRTSADTEKIIKAAGSAKSAVIIGGGAIGIEVAEALEKKGLKVSLVEALPRLMQRVLDEDFSQKIEEEMKRHGVNVLTGAKVDEIVGKGKVEAVKAAGKEIPADLVLLAIGVKPSIELAQSIGVECSRFGIKTNEFMETSLPRVFAAGDCSSCFSHLFGQEVPTRLAPRAVLEGKIAGKNTAGQIVTRIEPYFACFSMSVYDLALGSVGFNQDSAQAENIKAILGQAKSLTQHDSFPQAKPIEVKLIFDKERKLIGGAIIGGEKVAQRLNLLSLAILKGASAEDLSKIDYTSYPKLTPLPFAEPIVMAAEDALSRI